ncbi:MAG TPA: hypothetical protein DD381_07610 [Lentisphaeria bacterium]|nr:MAG: hypothetical protein A2X47_04190 [Lentisphaerae bacterium GWF2_38_69]HBM16188.1 hypothetical protein [Lentisphaeria bacterium]
MIAVFNDMNVMKDETINELDFTEVIAWMHKEQKLRINVNYDVEEDKLNYYDCNTKKYKPMNQMEIAAPYAMKYLKGR